MRIPELVVQEDLWEVESAKSPGQKYSGMGSPMLKSNFRHNNSTMSVGLSFFVYLGASRDSFL